MSLATTEGTARYAARMASQVAVDHFRPWPLHGRRYQIASLGIGTYTGDADDATDAQYGEAVNAAVRSGFGVIDCAINYRHMRSERAVGAALKSLFSAGDVARDEIWVMTKGGFLPFDGERPSNPRAYLSKTYLESLILPARHLVGGSHSIDPGFLRDQLKRSLDNLGLEGVDTYFLHNPETQLLEIPRAEFKLRVAQAFQFCEEAVSRGKIATYGLATWEGFRVPRTHKQFLDLDELLAIAHSVAGDAHHLRVIQLPFNLAMPEAMTVTAQRVGGQPAALLQAAAQHGLLVFSSVPLLQTRLLPLLPPEWARQMPQLRTAAQRALQFARSTPGIWAPLVGMKSVAHVEENRLLASVSPMDLAQLTG